VTPILVGVALLLAAGCAQTKSFLTSGAAPEHTGTARILLMAPDIEVAELTAAGLLEPKKDWTIVAASNVDLALDEVLAAYDTSIVKYKADDDGAAYDDPDIQLIKLHEAVGTTILLHKYIPALALPTKKDTFDWSLGEGASALGQKYQADYALFIYLRDSFSSGGRVALIFVGALFGVGVPGGSQVGFASLVDLRNGDIVWFNRLASGTGDLRDPKLAREATEALLSKIPL